MRKILAVVAAAMVAAPVAHAQDVDAHGMFSQSTVGVGYRVNFGNDAIKPVHSLRMGFNMDTFGGSSVSESYRIDFRNGELPMHYIAGMDMATFRSVIMRQGEAGAAAGVGAGAGGGALAGLTIGQMVLIGGVVVGTVAVASSGGGGSNAPQGTGTGGAP